MDKNIIQYQTLSDWISSLNTIRTNLSAGTYTDITGASVDSTAKASTINNYLAAINELRNNSYGTYGVYAISNPESVTVGTLIKDDINSKIDATLQDLSTLCGNTVKNVASSGFSLQGAFVSGFSRTSFSQTLITSFSDFSNNSADKTKFTDFNDECAFFSKKANFSDEMFFSDHCTEKGTYCTNKQMNTSFSTDTEGFFSNTSKNQFSRNTVFTDCTEDPVFSKDTEFSKDTDFSPDTCNNTTKFSNNSNDSVFSDMTNFNPNSSCDNTCSITGTTNSLTSLFTGYAVRT